MVASRTSGSNNKKHRLLIIDVCNPLSLGGAAITLVMVKFIKRCIPNTEIVLMPTRWQDRDIYLHRYQLKNVEFVSHLWYRERYTTAATVLHSFIPAITVFLKFYLSNLLRKLKVKNSFSKYDAIIDLNSDSINEHYGMVFPLFTLFNLLLASFSGKPVIVSPCTVGTFKNPFVRFIARFTLNRMTVIAVREEIGLRNLLKLGVSKPKIMIAADLAFLFEPKQINKEIIGDNIERGKPIIGIAPSQEISQYAFTNDQESLSEKYEKYIKLMAEIVEFITERFDASILLFPHSLSEKGTSRYLRLDDRIACERIQKQVKNKSRVVLVNGELRADEIKSLIGMCDLFVGCRMHATIAATSSYVPTIVLAYGEKFEGILGKLMGQEDRIINVSLDYRTLKNQLQSRIVSTWEQRDTVKRELQDRLKSVQEYAFSTFDALKEQLEAN